MVVTTLGGGMRGGIFVRHHGMDCAQLRGR
jgi:hypothetical protein